MTFSPYKKIVGPQLFEGINDTLRILINAVGETKNEKLIQLEQDLDLIITSPLNVLKDVWQKLER